MKLIAHRGGSVGKENSLSTIIESARLGADAVECDIRKTKDGVYIIYHDEYLTRLTGKKLAVSDTTYEQISSLMQENGLEVLTFSELAKGYKEQTPILLHVKLTDYDEDFARYVVSSGLPLIVGVVSLDMLKCFTPFLKPENVLAFLPSIDDAKDFYNAGAGIIRLWEHWLTQVTPTQIKEICPNAEVYIMASRLELKDITDISLITLEDMDGSILSLEKCEKLGADGVLLNKIEMALEWRKKLNK